MVGVTQLAALYWRGAALVPDLAVRGYSGARRGREASYRSTTTKELELGIERFRMVQGCDDVMVVAEDVGRVVVVALVREHAVVGHGADFAAVFTPDAFDGGDHRP